MTNELREDLERIGQKFEEYELDGKTILVTGSTGLIGSFLIRAAALYNENHDNKVKIIALARSEEKVADIFKGYSLEDISFLYQNLENNISLDHCDYIIHTASPTTSHYFISNPVEVIHTIYEGTKNMLELARKVQVEGFVYLSSMETFGIVEKKERVKEEELGYIDLQNVRSCYSEGKRVAEFLCYAYAKEYNVPVKICRLAQTFGAGVLKGENRVFAQFARSCVNGDPIVLHTTGESVGNYVYLRDAAAAILLLLNHGNSGDVYSVVNEETTMSIKEMAELVAESIGNGKSNVIIDIPEGKNLGYAPATQLRLSAQKIKQLGWKPEVDLVTAYKRMIPDLL